eukprot:6557794-Pyramimonas_sp.AAC.1
MALVVAAFFFGSLGSSSARVLLLLSLPLHPLDVLVILLADGATFNGLRIDQRFYPFVVEIREVFLVLVARPRMPEELVASVVFRNPRLAPMPLAIPRIFGAVLGERTLVEPPLRAVLVAGGRPLARRTARA